MGDWPQLDWNLSSLRAPCVKAFRSRALPAAILLVSIVLPIHALAGPRVINETARIENPDPSFMTFADDVAILGDDAIVTALRSSSEYSPDYDYERTAFLFTRNSQGAWQFVSRLVTNPEYWGYPLAVAMDDGIAAIGAMETLDVFERGASGWVHTASPGGPGLMVDLELEGGTIAYDNFNDSAAVLERDAAGAWVQAGNLAGPQGIPEGEFLGALDVDVGGDTVVISGYDAPEFQEGEGPQTHFYSNASGSYVRTALFPYAGSVATSGNYTVLAGYEPFGIRVFERDAGSWRFDHIFAPAHAFVRGAGEIEVEDDLVVFGGSSVSVFKLDANGTFNHVAELVPSDLLTRSRFGENVDIDGRRVIVSAESAAYVFELPLDLSQPAMLQDDFEDGNAADWTPEPGSSFSVVTLAHSRVLRQSSLAGAAAATLGADWNDQAIHADVTPRAFNGVNRWFGLAVRKLDSNNYYYVTLRSSNVLELKKIVNGTYQTLAAAAVPVTIGHTYRVTLEAVGNLVSAYVDGQLMARAHDSSLSHGRAGVQMYRTHADYDNVMVSPSPLTRLFEDEDFSMWRWTTGENGSWSKVDEGSSRVYEQSAIQTSTPRAITGVDTDDQIVSARAKAMSFGTSPNAWFGVLARYVDDQNYYYVTVRKDSTISLRKLVNGVIHVFDTAQLAVTPGSWYRLRLEAVGNHVRVYVNDVFMLEGVDNQPIQSGRYGMMTYRTAARFGDFVVVQP